MALVKPQIDQIQSKLKKTKDPEKQKELQMEMMKVYKENNVNPLAMGCLPMLIQIQLFLAFTQQSAQHLRSQLIRSYGLT